MLLKKKSRILSLLVTLVLMFAALSTTCAAEAAPAISIGAIEGVKESSGNAGGDTWTATAKYHANMTRSVITLNNVTGSGFDATATSANITISANDGTNWTIASTTAALNAGDLDAGSYVIKGVPGNWADWATLGVVLTIKIQDNSAAATEATATINVTFEAVTDPLVAVFETPQLDIELGNRVVAPPSAWENKLIAYEAGGTTLHLDSVTLADIYTLIIPNNQGFTWNNMVFSAVPSLRLAKIYCNDVTTERGYRDIIITFNTSAGEIAQGKFRVVVGDAAPTESTISLTDRDSGSAITSMQVTVSDVVNKVLDITFAPLANETIQSIAVSPQTWNGLTFAADLAGMSVTISGTAEVEGQQTVTVTATLSNGETITYSIVVNAVLTPSTNSGIIDETKIGIWDYGNKAMNAVELVYYNPRSANTGYNTGGKYDLLFFANRIVAGENIRVYLKDPGDDRYIEIPRMKAAEIPLEAWYYVTQTLPTDPYTSTAPSTRGAGTSLGWYRSDVNQSAGTMTIAVNSGPKNLGEYTFRIEYSDAGIGATHQTITLLATKPTSGGGSGGGCSTGASILALAAALFCCRRRRG